MESCLEKAIVLSLNAGWSPIGWRTVKQAITSLSGGDGGHPALALDISLDKEGKVEYARPVEWEEWLTLPVRDSDMALRTKNKAIRVPMVIICRNYAKIPVKLPRLTREAIRQRDGGRCGYTGEYVGNDGNVDHILPRDRGGRDEWENLVWCKKDINFKKGNKLNSEAGLVLRTKPASPKPMPISFSMEPKRPEHSLFLNK